MLVYLGGMRILHTSDWHLGAALEGVSRDLDHAAFLSWLGGTLEAEKVDVLVVAGDVFDQAQPSSEAQRLYFNFLDSISGKALRKVVIVGGNHDSPSRLDAPTAVLEKLSVHVVGGLQSDEARARCLCPIPGKNGGVDLVVVAVPFVHEYWLGLRAAITSNAEVRAAFGQRFTDFYRSLADQAVATSSGAPLIATGHLTCSSAAGDFSSEDFPAEIHMVGSIGGLPPEIFDERFRYVALGHIHRSYQVGASQAYYSGSPITLSLAEAKRARSVRIVDVGSDGTQVRTVEVPQARSVLELTGTVSEVADKLRGLQWDNALPPIVYASVEVEAFRATAEEELRKAATARSGVSPHLVQVRQSRPRPQGPGGQTAAAPVGLRELTAEEVFLKLCAHRQESVDEALLNAFRSLVSEGSAGGVP